MKTVLALLLLLGVSTQLKATEGYSRHPGGRQAAPVPEDLANPFLGNAVDPQTQEHVNERGDIIPEPDGFKTVQAYLAAHPVTALAWSTDPDRCSVVIDENVLRVGSNLSPDFVEYGDRYRVQEIRPDRVVFVASGHSKYTIVVPIALREPIKSRSSTRIR